MLAEMLRESLFDHVARWPRVVRHVHGERRAANPHSPVAQGLAVEGGLTRAWILVLTAARIRGGPGRKRCRAFAFPPGGRWIAGGVPALARRLGSGGASLPRPLAANPLPPWGPSRPPRMRAARARTFVAGPS